MLEVAQLLLAPLAENDNMFTIPYEPDQYYMRPPIGPYRTQPDHRLVSQTLIHAGILGFAYIKHNAVPLFLFHSTLESATVFLSYSQDNPSCSQNQTRHKTITRKKRKL